MVALKQFGVLYSKCPLFSKYLEFFANICFEFGADFILLLETIPSFDGIPEYLLIQNQICNICQLNICLSMFWESAYVSEAINSNDHIFNWFGMIAMHLFQFKFHIAHLSSIVTCRSLICRYSMISGMENGSYQCWLIKDHLINLN